LWVRNGRYYAQLTVEDEHTGQKQVRRVRLEGAATAAQANQKLEELRVHRRKGKLPALKLTPKFSDFAESYMAFYKQAKDAKRASTLETEQYAINQWKTHLGHVRLDKIKRIHIDNFIAARQKVGMSARTVNLEVTVFRNVMKRAIDEKWILHLPTENLRPLKSKPHKRQLFARKDIDNLLSISLKPVFVKGRLAKEGEEGQRLQNGQEFADYLRLLCFSGARMTEAMRLRWSDVDWDNRQLTIGSDGEVKNRKWGVVDCQPRAGEAPQGHALTPGAGLNLAFPIASTWRRGPSSDIVSGKFVAGPGSRGSAHLRLPRLPPLFHLHVRDVWHRFYDDCAMGGASGWGSVDWKGLRAPLKRTRETPGAEG
jgi:integrase